MLFPKVATIFASLFVVVYARAEASTSSMNFPHDQQQTLLYANGKHSHFGNRINLPYDDVETLRADVKSQRRSLATAIWEQMGDDLDGTAPGDQFGFSLALSDDGSTLAVGAFYKDGTGSTGSTLTDSGEVRVFRFINNQWVQFGPQIQGEGAGDQFGTGVALSRDGNTMVVGGINSSNFNGVATGHVRMFKLIQSGQFLIWKKVSPDIDGYAAGDEFGRGVALSDDGNIVAVGAPLVDSVNGADSGRVVVYRYVETSSITGFFPMGSQLDGKGAGNYFGYSVSLSGDGLRLAVGAYKSDGTSGVDSGTIRAFRFLNNAWVQLGTDIHGEMKGDQLGMSIAMSKSGLVIASGAPLNDGNGVNSGSVRAYKFDGYNWQKLGDDIDGSAAGDAFGVSVALAREGTVLVIGGFLNESGTGYVRIFEYSTLTKNWIPYGPEIEGSSPNTLFGRSVGMSEDGNILAVGGPWSSGNGGQTSGLVRVYKIASDSITRSPTSSPTTENFLFENGVWKPFGSSIVSSYSRVEFGNTVSFSGDGQTMAVGAPMISCASGANCGLVKVYYFQNGTWMELGGEIKGSIPSSKLGTSVKLSRDAKTLVVGSLQGVNVYEQLNGIWLQIGATIPGESSGDSFGQSVDVSDDGQFIIVGAPFNDGANGQNSGHARVFRRSNNLWTQIGNDIDGEASWDLSGYSVSMSADAAILAVSAFMNAGNGAFAGHVRTFKWDTNIKDWSQIGLDIDGSSAGDQFGSSISQSASGTVLAVGAPRSNKYGTLSGYVKVLSLSSANVWIQKGQEIKGEAGEGFGAVVSLSDDGDVVAIRSYDSVALSSQVKVYYFINGLWERVNGIIDADNSLSMSLAGTGTFVAVGGRYEVKAFQLSYSSYSNAPTKKPSQHPSISAAPTEFEDKGTPSGPPSSPPTEEPTRMQIWYQLGNDLVSSENNVYQYGQSISLVTIDGSSTDYDKILAIGQPQGSNQRGTVYVYKFDSSSRLWIQLGNVISGNSAEGRFGTSVKLSADGKILAVGAILAKNVNDVSVGEVSVYELDEDLNSWVQIGQFFGSNDDDQAGRSVALSVSTEIIDGRSTDAVTVAYGIPKYDPSGQLLDGGIVKIYRKLGDSEFEQLGNDLQGTNAKDGFGSSVSLSDDGKILAVGSIGHDLNSTVNNVGKVTVYRLDGSSQWQQLGNEITGSASGDQAGFSVSLSGNGNTIAIGIPWADDSDRENVGLVRLFGRNNNDQWSLVKEIIGEGSMDNFGYCVSMDKNGETLVVGAFQNDGVFGENSGHVRVYRQEMNDWKQIGADIDGENSGDLFGYSVSISSDGQYFASSAILNGDNGPFSGHVKVFEAKEIPASPNVSLPSPPTSAITPTAPTKMPSARPTSVPTFETIPVSSWEPISNSIVYGISTNDYFGWASSLSQDGKTLAVSSPFSDVGGTNSGQVIIYELNAAGVWVQKGLELDGLDTFDRFGSSVDLSADGNIIVVGARDRSTSTGNNSGETIVYKYDGVDKPWVKIGLAIAGEGSKDAAGSSVSISDDGNIIAIGAPLNSNNGGTGHARVYGLQAGQWKKLGQDLDATNLGDQFGRSVSLSGDGTRVAVSALGHQNFKGMVRVFEYDPSGFWLQLGSDLVGTESNSYFGATISLSQDGTIIAIGSLSSSTKVYKFVNNQWKQLGNDIAFGYTALSLSNDGLTLALSNNLSDDQFERVQVYRYITNTWIQMGQALKGESDGIWFGLSVSLSGNGNVLAISSPKYDTLNGENAGKVQVFYDTSSSFSSNSQSSLNVAGSVSSDGHRNKCSLLITSISVLGGCLLLYNF